MDAVIVPGLRERAHASRVRELRGFRRRDRRSARGSGRTSPGRPLARRTCSRSRASARSNRCAPASRRRRLQLLGSSRDCGRRARAAGDRLPRGLRRRSRRGEGHGRRSAHASRSRRSSGSGSPRTPHTPARSTPTGSACRSASQSAHTSPRARTKPSGSSTAPVRSRRSRGVLVPPPGQRPVEALEPVLCPELLCAHCVDVNDGEIALLAARGVPVAHCPRSNALLGCGIAPLRGSAREVYALASAPIRPPRRRRSTCSRSCGRRSTRPGPQSAAPTPWGRGRARAGDDRRGPRAATRRRGGYA